MCMQKKLFECHQVRQKLIDYLIPRLTAQLIKFISKNGFMREYIFMELGFNVESRRSLMSITI